MASHTGDRSVEERYNYFVRGRQLIIIENREDVTATAGNDAPSYQAPSETLVDGLMLEYTSIPDVSGLLDETDDIPVDEVLARAIVDFVKSEMAEEPTMKEYYMQRFTKRVVRYTEGRVGGLRRIVGNGLIL